MSIMLRRPRSIAMSRLRCIDLNAIVSLLHNRYIVGRGMQGTSCLVYNSIGKKNFGQIKGYINLM